MDQPSIKAIDKVSVARICSGQVITDLATAVKELVENSLDAGAKHVEVKLKEFGLDLIEVSDNGSGVSPSNYEGLALKYHTSKLSMFSDLTCVKSFGFRGEALSSLCELAGSFSVTTRTTAESVGVRLTYGRNGKLLKKLAARERTITLKCLTVSHAEGRSTGYVAFSIFSAQETAPRQIGTTVSVSNMFEPLPVRRGEFRRNIKKQYNRLLRGMQAYALISIGARITVTNTKAKAKGGKQTLIGTQYNNKLEDNVTNVFGAKFLSTLTPVEVPLMEESESDNQGRVDEKMMPANAQGKVRPAMPDSKKDERKIWGMVSRAGEGVGRADNDRQFVYINGRPVDLPKLTRAVNEVWRAYEMKQKPAFVLDVRLPPGSFDVNVTPDKREVFMTGEAEVVEFLKKALHEQWAPSRYTMPLNQGQLVQARLTDGVLVTARQPATKSSPAATTTPADAIRYADIVSPGALVNLAVSEGVPSEKRDVEIGVGVTRENTSRATELPVDIDSRVEANGLQRNMVAGLDNGAAHGWDGMIRTPTEAGVTDAHSSSGAIIPGDVSSQSTSLDGGERASDGTASPKRFHSDGGREGESMSHGAPTDNSIPRGSVKRTRARAGDAAELAIGASQDMSQHKDTGEMGKGSQCSEKTTSDSIGATNSPPIVVADGSSSRVRARGVPGVPLAFDMSNVLEGCRKASLLKRQRDARNASARSFSGKLSGTASAEDQDSKAAARAFSRVLRKEHFTQMRVVGQFNLGFIICLLGADLFILDQHACDEKYNFEVLQKTTIIHQQPLVRPLLLETSASEEMTIMDNIAVFEKNGFRFEVDDEQPPTKKLKVTAVPFSKGTQFGVGDVHELASIVADNSGEMVRLPKARAMFASRACRSSIMIGRPLDKGQMARVVAKMETIEQPWNCPHGRPTMRHLADVSKSLRSMAALDALLEES